MIQVNKQGPQGISRKSVEKLREICVKKCRKTKTRLNIEIN